MVVFLVSSGKNEISPFFAPPGKISEKSPSAPPEKNPSDAHVCRFIQVTILLVGLQLKKIKLF